MLPKEVECHATKLRALAGRRRRVVQFAKSVSNWSSVTRTRVLDVRVVIAWAIPNFGSAVFISCRWTYDLAIETRLRT